MVCFARVLGQSRTFLLKVNNYPNDFLEKCLKSVTPPRKNSDENSMMGFAIVPYIQGITEPIKRILGSFNVKVTQKPFLTLRHIFAKPKNRKRWDDAIYLLHSVQTVIKEYIGQTFGTRLKEHQKTCWKKMENSALSEHVCKRNHEIAWDN